MITNEPQPLSLENIIRKSGPRLRLSIEGVQCLLALGVVSEASLRRFNAAQELNDLNASRYEEYTQKQKYKFVSVLYGLSYTTTRQLYRNYPNTFKNIQNCLSEN